MYFTMKNIKSKVAFLSASPKATSLCKPSRKPHCNVFAKCLTAASLHIQDNISFWRLRNHMTQDQNVTQWLLTQFPPICECLLSHNGHCVWVSSTCSCGWRAAGSGEREEGWLAEEPGSGWSCPAAHPLRRRPPACRSPQRPPSTALRPPLHDLGGRRGVWWMHSKIHFHIQGNNQGGGGAHTQTQTHKIHTLGEQFKQ